MAETLKRLRASWLLTGSLLAMLCQPVLGEAAERVACEGQYPQHLEHQEQRGHLSSGRADGLEFKPIRPTM